MMKKLALAIAAAFALSGCAAVEFAKDNPGTASLAVKSGTLAFVEQIEPISRRIERAEEVIVVVNFILDQMDSSTSATVSTLSSEVRSQINWNDMDAYERLLLDSLIFSVESKLKERVGDGILAEDDKLVVRSVLEWAKEAANMYAKGRV